MTDSEPFSQADAAERARHISGIEHQGPTIPDWLQQEQRDRQPQPAPIKAKQSRFGRAIEYAHNHKGEVVLYTALGAVASASLALLISGGGGRPAEAGDTYGVNDAEIDSTISSITLKDGANLRFDPYVSGENQEPNLVESLGASITIDANHDFKVIDGTDDGQWIGVRVEDIKNVDPQFDDRGDNDGIVWVNEQGFDSVQRDDVETK